MLNRKPLLFCLIFTSLFSISSFSDSSGVYLFSKQSLEENGFFSIPVDGYSMSNPECRLFPAGDSFIDGFLLTLKPGEAAFYAVRQSQQTGKQPMVITLEYNVLHASSGHLPQVAVVGLNTPDGTPDGQLGYFYLSAPDCLSAVQRLHLVYTPPSGTFLPAVQVSLDSNASEESLVVLYSLSIRTFDPQGETVHAEYDFKESPEPMTTNINGDSGQVLLRSEHHNVSLAAPGDGGAANFRLLPTIQTTNVSLIGLSGDFARVSGEDGTTAMLLEHAGQNLGLFIKNSELVDSPQSRNLWIAGNIHKEDAPTYLYVQNGGGVSASEITTDNLKVVSYSLDSIHGLGEALPIDEYPDSLSVVMILPQTYFSGSQGSFSLTALDKETRHPVYFPYDVTLTQTDQKVTLAHGVTDQNGFSSQTFSVPVLSNGTWNVELASAGRTILKGETSVKNSGVLLINTDKPIYKPGQTLQGRVLLLNNALQPLNGDVQLTIADAKGITIHRETLAVNEYGVASFELPLASELNFGTWKITASSGDEDQNELDVEVDQYVLPSFEVDLNTDKSWYKVDERITGTVDSRYFFGKPVQGKIHLSALKYVSTWDEYATVDGVLDDGRYSFDLPPVEYVAGTSEEEGAGSLQLKVIVTDDTGKEESTDALVKIVDSGITLKLIPESPVIKPGLNQELLIVSETPDGAPLSLPVTITISFSDENGEDLGSVKDQVTTEQGVAHFQYDVPAKAQIAILTASASQDGSTAEESSFLYAAYSPGANYIHLRQQNEGTLKAGNQAVFDLYATHAGTVYYDVYGNGRTLFSNTTDGNQIQFTITPEMSPSAKLVAYMIEPNSEVSADVLPFDVELSSTTELTASFSADEVKPGDPVSLSLQSDTPSMLGISIVDESVYALAEGRLNLKNVFAELERIFMEPQAEVHIDPSSSRWSTQPVQMGKGTEDILADHDFQILTTSDLIVPKAKEIDPWTLWANPLYRDVFPPVPAIFDNATGGIEKGNEGDSYQEPDRVRTYFPETWVWLPEQRTDDAGKAVLDLTAPDSITTWKLQAVSTSAKGLGITDGSLRVFQDFFAEPDLPYSVIRGDEFPLLVRVFNYVDEAQTIRVTLQNPNDLGLEGEAMQEVTVPGQSAASVRFTLKPTKVGTLPVSLIAQSSQRADAIQKDLLVKPEGLSREQVQNGVLKNATEAIVDLSFPDPLVREPLMDGDGSIFSGDETTSRIAIIPDSETLRVAVTPNLVGQSLEGLDDLLGMPYGCGEQNMIFTAPNIEILRYLKTSGQLAPAVRAKSELFITTGYQRELTFLHDDGSFSAFGKEDDSGSLWLTAFVLSTFSSAREVQTIDSTVLNNAAQWINRHQNEDGSWDPVGFVIHQELVGGLNGNLSLTAYVTAALLEYGNSDSAALQKAISYLEANVTNENADSYTLAQIAYVLAKANRSTADQAITRLMDQSLTDANGLHWDPHPIETTAYAAMALTLKSRIESQSALQWISAQRNSLGGYGSTQDTVVALKALTAAAAQQSRDLDAKIEVLVNGEVLHTFTVNSDNFDVLQTLEMAPANQITLRMSGSGTVMYQVVHGYNVPVFSEPVGKDLDIKVEYSSDHIAVDDLVDVRVSVDYMGTEKETGMAIVDVSVPTGFEVVSDSLDKVREMELIKRIETAGRKVIFYVDHFTNGETFELTFQVKALYPVKADSGTSAAYLYYDTNTRAETGGETMMIQ